MKTLLIMRHAKSSWKAETLPDFERPLNKRGKHDAPRMGRLIRAEGLTPDVILSSPAARARATAEAVADLSKYEGEVKFVSEFYEAGPEAYLKALRTLPDEVRSALVIGHNPALDELLESLIGESEHLPTAALARVKLRLKRWKDLNESVQGKLADFWSPGELE
jgi:phosphohistidine phosphatase